MPIPKRPRDGNQLAKLVVDTATGEAPNDKDEVLAPAEEPSGRAKSAKARADSQTPERRSEVARKAAEARWGNKTVRHSTTQGSLDSAPACEV